MQTVKLAIDNGMDCFGLPMPSSSSPARAIKREEPSMQSEPALAVVKAEEEDVVLPSEEEPLLPCLLKSEYTPATSPGPSIKEEEEDEKPDIGRRRSRRPVVALNYVEDEDVKPFAKRGARSTAPEAEEERKIKKLKTEGDHSPEMEEEPLLTVKEEEEIAKLEDDWQNQQDRPAFLRRDGFNLLDISTYAEIPELNPDDATIPALLAEEPFHRPDLAGSPQDTLWGGGKDGTRFHNHGYTNCRECLRADLQLGVTTPGKPFVGTGTVTPDWESINAEDGPSAIFVQLKKPSVGEASWVAFGLYRIAYSGRALDGEFSRLPADRQEFLIKVIHGYLITKKTSYTRVLFSDCDIDPHPETGAPRNLLEHRSDLSRAQQRAYIRKYLEDNNKLKMGYNIMVYAGDNAKEIAECKVRREQNRAKGAMADDRRADKAEASKRKKEKKKRGGKANPKAKKVKQ
ncbi:hypothetical protein JCM10213_005192 [Rhodosporidiobolus nylandii]